MPKKHGGARTLAKVLVGSLLGLAIAEAAFHLRDGGAFPHLNVYAADPELGVRLRPGETETVSFGGNPATSVRINAEGYRGADWGPPGENEVLVVGDSQAFGLGVEEGQTFSEVAGKALDARVLNAGVPTYGPPELERVIAEVLGKRKPRTVVYVVNFVNDPFEARRRNVERHAVWDGWAVRRETAPASVTTFPGRDLLFRRSHAVFALRQYLYYRDGLKVMRLPSEGGAEDLVSLSAALEKEQARAKEETAQKNETREAETRAATLLAINADQRVKQIAFRDLKLSDGIFDEGSVYLASGASPGDIVIPQLGEEGSPLGATAEYIQQAAKLRGRIERELKERALARADEEASKTTLDALERRDAFEARLRELHRAPIEIVRATQPIVEAVLRAKKLAEDQGARFVLLALPMDVQISTEEWKKYGNAPLDMKQSLVLVRDLVEAVRDAGGIAVDPTEPLRAAQPGAFLDRDPHLSPKGHEVVGKALADALKGPPPKRRPGPLLALPEGRSRLPRPGDWDKVGELLVHGSDAAGCKTQRIREWMRVHCTKKEKSASIPQGVRVLRGGHGEAITLARGGAVTLIAPVVRGDEFAAKLSWSDRSRDLTVSWPAELVETDRFLKDSKEPPDPAPSIDLAPVCACMKGLGRSCDDLAGYADAACMTTYAAECASMVACVEGNPVAMPACKEGETNAGAALRCFATCEKDGDCKQGRCVESQGARLCIGP